MRRRQTAAYYFVKKKPPSLLFTREEQHVQKQKEQCSMQKRVPSPVRASAYIDELILKWCHYLGTMSLALWQLVIDKPGVSEHVAIYIVFAHFIIDTSFTQFEQRRGYLFG